MYLIFNLFFILNINKEHFIFLILICCYLYFRKSMYTVKNKGTLEFTNVYEEIQGYATRYK